MPVFPRIVLAAATGDLADLIECLDQGDNIEDNSSGCTPLLAAAQEGHFEICLTLLQRGANVDSEGAVGQTPLWLASHNGHHNIVQLLCEHNAFVDKVANEVTPLWIAIQKNHSSVVHILIDNKANINFCHQGDGVSCLLKATFDQNSILANYLIIKKVDVNLSDYSGQTPLMAACSYGDVDLTLALLNAGANIFAHTIVGHNALYFAKQNNHVLIETLLLNAGAVNIGETLLPNFLHYLEYLKRKNPEKYDENLFKDISKGLCAGYATLCLILTESRKIEEFHHDLKRIALWNQDCDALSHDKFLDESMYNVITTLCSLQEQTKVNFLKHDLSISSCYTTEVSCHHLFALGFLFEKKELEECFSVIFESINQVVVSNLYHALSIRYTGTEQFIVYNFSSPSGPISITGTENLCKYIWLALNNQTDKIEDKDTTEEKLIGLKFDFIGVETTLSSASEITLKNYLLGLIQKRVNTGRINIKDHSGCTALHFAMGNGDIVLSLLQNGARAEAVDNDSVPPPIFLAITAGLLPSIINELCIAGANINTIYNKFSTLLWATREGDLKSVALLLELGVDIEYRHPTMHKTALFIAALKCHVDIFCFLLEKKAIIYSDILFIAIHCGHLEIVKILDKNGMDLAHVNRFGETPLSCAIDSKKHDIATYIREKISEKFLVEGSLFAPNSSSGSILSNSATLQHSTIN